METVTVKYQSKSKRIVYVVDNLIHILIIALLFYVLWIPIKDFRSLLSWHAIFGTIAFLLLMSESISLLSNHLWVTKIVTNQEKKIWTHGIIFTTAAILAVFSVCFEYYRKSLGSKGHFYTAHGVTALIATMLTVIAFITGLSVSYYYKFEANIRLVTLKLVHNIFGQSAYGLGMFSLCCAYYSNWIIGETNSTERGGLLILTGFLTIWILIHAVKSMYSQILSLKE